MSQSELDDRIASVRRRIEDAARRVGRDPACVTLVAVSKTQSPEAVAAAYGAGLRLFGENRVEEAGPKAPAVAALVAPSSAPTWHMIGHVQGRKANQVLPWAAMVQSVDSMRLAQRLSGLATEAEATLEILLEVNVSGEASKYGLAPHEVAGVVEGIAALPGLKLEGLMTMAPISTDPESVRPVFARLSALRDEIIRQHPQQTCRHLSMGMTDDFEVAIEEGATLVRIGRAIFGERPEVEASC